MVPFSTTAAIVASANGKALASSCILCPDMDTKADMVFRNRDGDRDGVGQSGDTSKHTGRVRPHKAFETCGICLQALEQTDTAFDASGTCLQAVEQTLMNLALITNRGPGAVNA